MELVKSEPLIIGGRAHYTLTSYGPVEIEVTIPSVSEEEVDYALASTLSQMGMRLQDATDDWSRRNFTGARSLDDVREAVRENLIDMSEEVAEDEVGARCMQALARRLVQRVSPYDVARARSEIAQSFAASLQESGLSQRDFMAQAGILPQDLEAMFDEQAQAAAEQEAALDAYIDHFQLQVSDEELPELMMIAPQDARELISLARQMGQIDEVRRTALRAKAALRVIDECVCSYREETPEHAHARLSMHGDTDTHPSLRLVLGDKPDGPDGPDSSDGANDSRSHLRLV